MRLDALIRRRASWGRTGLTVAALALCVGLVAGMAWLVLRELDELSTANSDNLQWSLAQADVEFLRFQLALERAQDDPAALASVRRRFDIFYSRLSTLERGEVFRSLRADPEFDVPRAHVKTFIDSTVPLIDGPPEALAAALPDLAARSDEVAEDVRRLSLTGLAAFAALSDVQRNELTEILLTMAAVLAVLFAGLLLVAIILLRVGRLAEARTQEVQQTAIRLRTIVETSLDAIVVTDAQGLIREFNPAARRMFGHDRARARGARMIDLLFPAEAAASLRAGKLRFLEADTRPAPHDRQLELTAQGSDGRRFPVEMSVDRADAEDDRVFVAFFRDISRRKAAEEGLTEARDRALAGERAKAEFLAVMSHEMRTPLNGLLGTMQLLRDHSLSEGQSELLDRMQSSGNILLTLVNDVLDLAKFEAGKMEAERGPFSITRLLDGVVETAAPLALANGTSLSWTWVGPEAPGAVGDPRRLRQVLLNLVGNAIKFTRGGSVEIEAEILGSTFKRVEFRVIDSGIGIAEADLDRIFNDFETLDSSYARQAGGTGLGLGIARRLVEMMSGEIGAESEPGAGSLFWIRVPFEILDTAPQPRPLAVSAPGNGTASLDLLLVEDNEINRYVARRMLEADGHRVTEAADGRAGVDWAMAQKFDAILMDISMPVMDGTEAARTIRSGDGASTAAPIIAVTAHALPEEVARFRDAGMAYCISKPIDRTVLRETLSRIGAGTDQGVAPVAPDVAERAALIDPGLLTDIWDGAGADGRAALVDRFLSETGAEIARLAEGKTAPSDLAMVAHHCAGSCGAFGMTALHAALADIAARAKRGAAIEPHELEALADLWQRSREALRAWMEVP